MASIRVYALVKPAEREFLEDYFLDTRTLVLPFETREDGLRRFSQDPAFLFLDPGLIPDKLRPLITRFFLQHPKLTVFFLTDVSFREWADRPNVISLGLPLTFESFDPVVLSQIQYPAEIRVLVIDDEPELCSGIKEYLESKRGTPSFLVDYALNGLEAYAKMEFFRPDVCILDLKMPVKSGHDFFREAQRRFPGFRSIILTSSVGPDEIAEIRKLGSPPVVEKGSQRSTFHELAELLKKTWSFS